MRPTLIIGNWKMNKSPGQAKAYLDSFLPYVESCLYSVYLAVPSVDLVICCENVKESPLHIGAQNVSEYENGAYTGEVSAQMLKEAGSFFSLVGHSERRRYFTESDSVLLKKVRLCLKYGLKVVFCFGETLEQRQAGDTLKVVFDQISKGLEGLTASEMAHVILAYEPVWAIGTGQTATVEQAQEVHRACREYVSKLWGKDRADTISILYGGSVTESTIKDLLMQHDIDGALVGGASLDPQVFARIIQCKKL